MLTPIDIDNQKFSRQFKGYDVDEVEDFLEEISNDYETLMMNNQKQEEKIKELEEKLNETLNQTKNNETILQDTLLIAKQSAEDMKKRAEEEAQKIIEEANQLLMDRVGNIDEVIEEKKMQLQNLKAELALYKTKTEALLIAQLEVLKNIPEEEF